MELIAMLPGVTGQWSFVPSSYRTHASDEEILRRFVIAAKLEGKTLGEVIAILQSPPLDEKAPWTAPLYNLLRGADPSGPIAIVRKLWSDPNLYGAEEARKLDFVIVSRSGRLPAWAEQVRPVFVNPSWKIFPASAQVRMASLKLHRPRPRPQDTPRARL
jgi:hypothetical protein